MLQIEAYLHVCKLRLYQHNTFTVQPTSVFCTQSPAFNRLCKLSLATTKLEHNFLSKSKRFIKAFSALNHIKPSTPSAAK